MGLILLTFLFNLQNQVFAENKNAIHIVTSTDYPTTQLNTKKFNINKKLKEDVIDSHQRDLFFEACGLIEKTSYFDHVDKDILLLRARSLSLSHLEIKYPDIDKKQLSCLKSKVKKD